MYTAEIYIYFIPVENCEKKLTVMVTTIGCIYLLKLESRQGFRLRGLRNVSSKMVDGLRKYLSFQKTAFYLKVRKLLRFILIHLLKCFCVLKNCKMMLII